MLTVYNYINGKAISDQLKYNTNYNKVDVFCVVCKGLASKLLASEYADGLTEEQKEAFNKLINL